MRKAIRRFDAEITAWIQSWPGWLHQPMLAITNVGQPLTVILFTIGLGLWSRWHDHHNLMMATIIVLATIIISSLLKPILRRARPVNEYVQNMIIHSFSFPSGHAAAATVGFGFFAYLVSITLAQPWSGIIALCVVMFSLLVGVSRIYLGAHFPSDVAGGMALGLVGLVAAIMVVS